MGIEKAAKNLLTVKEVADYLRVNQTTIYRLVRRAGIPAFKIGGDWRFNLESIDQWLADADAASLVDVRRSKEESRARGTNDALGLMPLSQLLQLTLGIKPEGAVVLVRIYEALSQTVGRISRHPDILEALKRIADSLEEHRDTSNEIARLYKGDKIAFRSHSENLLKFVPAAFGAVDSDHHLASFNDAYRELFGFSRKHLRTVSVRDLVHPNSLESFTKLNARLWRGDIESARFEGRRLTGSGDVILIRSTAWPIRTTAASKPEYLAATIERLADQKQASVAFARGAERLAKHRETLLTR